MTDPFEALREPVTPVDPDPYFAEALRQRLTRRVFASPGGTMSQQTVLERQPAWPPALTPYIVVSDARRAMDWYIEVFGARRRGELHVNADGTIGHAEVGIGDAVLMFSEASDLWPDVPVRAPDSPATFSHSLHLEVENVDASTERARRTGASVEREPADQPYGRRSVIVGGPARCLESIEWFERQGVDMMLFLVQAGTIKHADIVDSLRRFGREVMPHFAGAARSAAGAR